MKKGLKLKLGMSVASLALLAGALSTTTYAWFTANATATTESVTAQAKSSGADLYLSNDGITFSASVTPVLKWGNTTTNYDGSTDKLDAVTGKFTENVFSATDKAGAAATTGYVYFDLYFKTTADSRDVVFGAADGEDDSTKVTSEGATKFTLLGNTADSAGTEITAGNQVMASIVNASRFGIVNYTSTAATTDGKAPEVAGDSAVASGSKIYMASEKIEDTSFKDFGSTEDVSKGAGAYYQNVMGEKLEHTTTTAPELFTTATLVSDLSAGQVGRIRVYIWLEGWDEDCFDAVLGQSMNMVFSFTTKAHAGE